MFSRIHASHPIACVVLSFVAVAVGGPLLVGQDGGLSAAQLGGLVAVFAGISTAGAGCARRGVSRTKSSDAPAR